MIMFFLSGKEIMIIFNPTKSQSCVVSVPILGSAIRPARARVHIFLPNFQLIHEVGTRFVPTLNHLHTRVL